MKFKKIFFFLLFFSVFLYQQASASSQSHFSDEILIKFKKPSVRFSDFAKNYGLEFSLEKNRGIFEGYRVFKINDGESANEKIIEVERDKLVQNAQPNFIFSPAVKKKKTKGFTSDRFIDRQWWSYNNGKYGTAGSDLGYAGFWPKETKTWKNVAVGIIDSGINPKHTDLKNNTTRGYDFVHGTGKKMRDRDGHGSFLAGLIASKTNNKKGIACMSRLNHLKVMPLKFDFSTDEAISAIGFAKKKGVRILNTSWGTEEFDQALYDEIKTFDGLVITASGNDGKEHNSENHFYPCDFDLENIICVGASSENDTITTYSDYGSTVDLLAPGGEDAYLIGLDTKKDRYIEAIGTSFSAAFVGGAAGLILSNNPSLSNLEIKNLLLQNVKKKESLAQKVSSGGILDILSIIK